MKKYKKNWVRVFTALVFIGAVVVQSCALSIGTARATNNDADETQRRWLHHFSNCVRDYGDVDDSVIETEKDFDDAQDPIGKQMDHERVVVGLDLDDDNGVVRCLTVIKNGVNILFGPDTIKNATKNDVGTWLFQYMTGVTVASLGGTGHIDRDTDAWEAKLNDLLTIALVRNSQLQSPASHLMQKRLVPLLNYCYEAKTAAGGPLGSYGFKEPNIVGAGEGFFYAKEDREAVIGTFPGGDNQKFSIAYWLHIGKASGVGDKREIFLGDLSKYNDGDGLGWHIGQDISGSPGGTWSFGSEFYPVGNDLAPPRGAGEDYEEGVVDCAFVARPEVRKIIFDGNVEIKDSQLVYKPNTPNAGESPTYTPPPVDPTATSTSCEDTFGDFGWIVCWTLRAIDSFTGWAEDAIKDQLAVDLGPESTRQSLQSTWAIMARFASAIIVVIALVMIIATALGSDLVSPYALKKLLPRLVIGAVGIWLSWAIISTYIDLMNDLGRGIAGLMLSPFGDAKDFTLERIGQIAAENTGGSGEGGVLVGLAAAGAIGAGVFGLLSLGLTVLFAFLVAIIVLALRQAVLVFLVVMAPLGVAMWILPNTQKGWKLWSGTLNKLLLMFPMIMALLAAGKIFAKITADSITNDGALDDFLGFAIALIAFVAPFFFLPALFKIAGGLFGNLTGMVNSKGKGIFDKARGSLDKRKAFTPRQLAKQQREIGMKQRKQQDFAGKLTGGGAVGKYRRFRAGGITRAGRQRVVDTADQAVTADISKQIAKENTGTVSAFVEYGGDAGKYIAKENRDRVASGRAVLTAKEMEVIKNTFRRFKNNGWDNNTQFAAVAVEAAAERGMYSAELAAQAEAIYTSGGRDKIAQARWAAINTAAEANSRKNGGYRGVQPGRAADSGQVSRQGADLTNLYNGNYGSVIDDIAGLAPAAAPTIAPTTYNFTDSNGVVRSFAGHKSDDRGIESFIIELAKVRAGETKLSPEAQTELAGQLARLRGMGGDQTVIADHIDDMANQRASRKYFNPNP